MAKITTNAGAKTRLRVEKVPLLVMLPLMLLILAIAVSCSLWSYFFIGFGGVPIKGVKHPEVLSYLAWDGNYPWSRELFKIHKIDPNTGRVVSSLDFTNSRGLAWDGNYLWCCDMSADLEPICQIDSRSGKVRRSFRTSVDWPIVQTWGDGYLWCGRGHTIYMIDPNTGSVKKVLEPSPSLYLDNLAWDGNYLWAAPDEDRRIYKIDPNTGRVVDSLCRPAPLTRASGLVWGDGFLWYMNRMGRIYKLKVHLPIATLASRKMPVPTVSPTPALPTATSIPIGMSCNNPIPIRQPLVADNKIEVTVLGVEHDTGAKVQRLYPLFFSGTMEDIEYIIITLRIRNLGDPAETKMIQAWDFRLMQKEMVKLPIIFVVEQRLSAGADLPSGATIKAQLIFQVRKGEKLVLNYASRYFSLEE